MGYVSQELRTSEEQVIYPGYFRGPCHRPPCTTVAVSLTLQPLYATWMTPATVQFSGIANVQKGCPKSNTTLSWTNRNKRSRQTDFVLQRWPCSHHIWNILFSPEFYISKWANAFHRRTKARKAKSCQYLMWRAEDNRKCFTFRRKGPREHAL